MYLYYKYILQGNDSKKEKKKIQPSLASTIAQREKTVTHSQFLFIVFKSIFKSFLIVLQYYGAHLALACGQMIKCLLQPH